MSRGKLPPDVPEFLEVVRLGALGGLYSECGIAASAPAAGDEVFALYVLGECEKRLGLCLRSLDQGLRNAVVADDRESIFLEAGAKLLRKAIGVAVGIASETEATLSEVRMSVMDAL